MPRSSNGIETDPITFFHVIETIARADASTAWCLSQAGGCAMSAAYLDLPVAQEIFGDDPRAVLAWGPGPRVKAIECEGGYKVTGVWAFASGGRHATWLGAALPDLAGRRLAAARRRRPASSSAPCWCAPSEVEWTDIWNTVGLRGTASDQFALTDHFVPRRPFDHARRSRESAKECREPGPLYRMSAMTCYEVGFAGVALGIARGASTASSTWPGTRSRAASKSPLRDNAVVQTNLAQAEVGIRSARAFLLQSLAEHLERDLGRRRAHGRAPHHHPHGLDQRHPQGARGGRLRLQCRRRDGDLRAAIRWSAASATSTP